MDNIIYYLEAHPLGDEIHMHRNVLLSLLEDNFISNETVIYCLSDRRFLYSNIFKNIFCYDDVGNLEEIKLMCEAKFHTSFTLIKNFDICYSIWDIWRNNGGFHSTLSKDILITKPNVLGYEKINYYNNVSYSRKFTELVTNIDYLDRIPKFENEKFIVYHHRIKSDNLWDADDQILTAILKYAHEYNLVIFSRKKFNFDHPSIYSTSDLREYASFINDENCLAVISIWSGGGQIASYCSNSKVFMYFHPSQLQYQLNEDQLDIYFKSENAFDFCQFTNAERRFVGIQDIIMNKLIF